MATLYIYITWVYSGKYLQTLRRKVWRLVRHRTPPRNQGGEIEGGGEVSWMIPCCSVRIPANRNCRLNLKTHLPDDSRRSWGGWICIRTLRAEGWTTTSRRLGGNDRGVGNHWKDLCITERGQERRHLHEQKQSQLVEESLAEIQEQRELHDEAEGRRNLMKLTEFSSGTNLVGTLERSEILLERWG